MNKGYEKLLATGRDIKDFTYQWARIKCKKVQCRSCPHGPYLYARYRQGTKLKSIYIGRHLPSELVGIVAPYIP